MPLNAPRCEIQETRPASRGGTCRRQTTRIGGQLLSARPSDSWARPRRVEHGPLRALPLCSSAPRSRRGGPWRQREWVDWEESNIQHGLYGSRGGAAIADRRSDWERRVPTVVQATASVRQRKEADEASCSWPSRHVVIAKTGTDTTRCACRQYWSPQNVRVLYEADAFAQACLPACPHQNYHMHYCHEHCVCSVMSLTAGRSFPVGDFGEDIEVR